MYSTFVRHVLDPIDLWRSGNSNRLRYFAALERSQYLSEHELRTTQEAKLKTLIDYVWRQCPYYRKLMVEANLVPADIRAISDLQILPILTKRDIQQHREEMVAMDYPRDRMSLNQTGGSTGEPVSFYVSRDRYDWRDATTRRHNKWAGLEVGDKLAVIWGAPPNSKNTSAKFWWRNKLIDRTLKLDTSNLDEKLMTEFDRALKTFRPKHILAYARSAALFCEFLNTSGITPFQPESIITSAELLTQRDRDRLESTFGCPVFNRYGCREFSVIASECERHQGLHICAEHLIVEVVPRVGEVADDRTGRLLITDLMNQAMPLIRYEIGDLGTLSLERCPCGRGLPLLNHVAGRATDFLVGADGRLVSGVFIATYVIAKFPALSRIQIRQYEPGQIVFLVPGNPETSIREQLVSEARKHLGQDMNVLIETVADPVLEPSGKFLFCKSHLARRWNQEGRAQSE